MPRTIKDILDHADELAKRFEDYEPSATDERDPAVFAELRRAVLSRSDAERSIRDAVKHARERGYSWAFIGSLVGTSGEAARQRYGHKQDAQAKWVWLGQGSVRGNALIGSRDGCAFLSVDERSAEHMATAQRRLWSFLTPITGLR